MPKEKHEKISGTVEDVVYRNPQNDYTVIDVAVSASELVTAVGIMPYVCEGEEVTLTGNFTSHAEYGRQFGVVSYEKKLPKSQSSMLKYLSSGSVKGIGPSTAVKIINRYGEDSFDVIEKHPQWLADIPGISMRKAAEISKSFIEMSGVRELMMFCRDYFGSDTIDKIYKKFGAGAVGIIKDNPYRLCKDMHGISFEKADSIAAALGTDMHSPLRLECGIMTVLKNSASSGHTCLPFKELCRLSSSKLGVEEDEINLTVNDMLYREQLKSYDANDTTYIYIKESYDAEAYIAKKLGLLDRATEAVTKSNVETMLERIETRFGIVYADMQKRAVYHALSRGVMVITGGPGTGKTTVVRAIIEICRCVGLKTVLAAPTGRAAKRMSEATGEEAKTIHRMLEMQRTDSEYPKFNRDEFNPLDEQAVIVDEASMIDVFLMSALLKALKNGTKLIMIGDCDQLPSVGAGNVLRDMISSGVFETVELSEVFRQSEKSLIVDNAHRINRGEMPVLDSKDSDFFFIPRSYEEETAKTVVALMSKRLPKTYGEEFKRKVQVITPSRKGVAGTESLNVVLQNTLNPKTDGKDEVRLYERIFRVGDRIMQMRNNYDAEWEKNGIKGSGVFNGDTGTVLSVDRSGKTVTLEFDDRIAVYDYTMMEDVEPAYAITVHKSQGSEYPVVIVPLYRTAPLLLTRNMIYTAITRAKDMVIICGDKEILSYMVSNDYQSVRYTNLLDMIIKKADKY